MLYNANCFLASVEHPRPFLVAVLFLVGRKGDVEKLLLRCVAAKTVVFSRQISHSIVPKNLCTLLALKSMEPCRKTNTPSNPKAKRSVATVKNDLFEASRVNAQESQCLKGSDQDLKTCEVFKSLARVDVSR